jgi:serine/threonine protein phosphatase PrpC
MDRELSRKHGAILYLPNKSGKKGSGNFVLTDLESTNGSYMRLVGPYGHKGMGALSVGDEFIVGRTGFSVNRFDYGISEAIGARPTMEDRSVVIQSLMHSPPEFYYTGEPKETLNELAMTTFAAVFDGHGGAECSNYLVDALPRHVRNQMLAEREALRVAIENSRGARGAHSEQTEDAASELMRRILKTSYLRADKEFISPKSAPQSGSTAATVILMGRRLFAANVGDSRVVLCRGGGQCVELTSDHKPSRPDEAARVRAAGGFILHKRVMGELAITRAFGDKSFKMGIKAMLEEEAEDMSGAVGMSDNDIAKDLTAPLVSAEPEIASMVLSHNDEFLLLACDGLFDVFRSQDAIALARQELIAHRGEPAEVARILSDQAIRVRRSRDNVSILIIVLRPFWEL